MTDVSAAVGSGRAPSTARPGLIDRHDLVAALGHAAEKVTVISAPAGSGKTSLLRVWAGRPGQDRRIAFMSVRPGQHDAQLFWLTVLGAVRDASGADRSAEPPPTTPGFNGLAMVDKVLTEISAAGDPFVLVIDDLHELNSAEAAEPPLPHARDRCHPPRPATAPAPATAGRRGGRDPSRAAALHRGGDPATRGRCPEAEQLAECSWAALIPGLTPHGLRHGHQTAMRRDRVPRVLRRDRLGHGASGDIADHYTHIADEMIEEMLTRQTQRWQAAVAARARIDEDRGAEPRSAVPALDEWLAPFRERDGESSSHLRSHRQDPEEEA